MIEEDIEKLKAAWNELAKEVMKQLKIKEMEDWLVKILDKVKGE